MNMNHLIAVAILRTTAGFRACPAASISLSQEIVYLQGNSDKIVDDLKFVFRQDLKFTYPQKYENMRRQHDWALSAGTIRTLIELASILDLSEGVDFLVFFLVCFIAAGTASIAQHIHPLLFILVLATIACILALIAS